MRQGIRICISVLAILVNAVSSLAISFQVVKYLGITRELDNILLLSMINTSIFEMMIAPLVTTLPRHLSLQAEPRQALSEVNRFVNLFCIWGSLVVVPLNFVLCYHYLGGASLDIQLLWVVAMMLTNMFQVKFFVVQSYAVALQRYWMCDGVTALVGLLQLACVGKMLQLYGGAGYFLVFSARYAAEWICAMMICGYAPDLAPSGNPISAGVKQYLWRAYGSQGGLVLTRVDTVVDRFALGTFSDGTLGLVNLARQLSDLITRILYRTVIYLSVSSGMQNLSLQLAGHALTWVLFLGVEWFLLSFDFIRSHVSGNLSLGVVGQFVIMQAWLSGVVLSIPLIHSFVLRNQGTAALPKLWVRCAIVTCVFSALKLLSIGRTSNFAWILFLISANYAAMALVHQQTLGVDSNTVGSMDWEEKPGP